ncbi:glycosyltransferase [Nocardia sp. NPDC057353]|uniref:glycosyltransferase n=1 Tax=Nocardia sp. NPDC057353 TaxID=3346104 RepID=UPI00363DD022
MSGLRVALIASSRHPIAQPFAGGLEAHVWHLAAALRARGTAVTLFAAAGSDPALGADTVSGPAFAPSAAAAGDPSAAPAPFLADHHAYLGLMLRLRDTGRAEFDVVHNHSLHYLPVAMAAGLGVPMLTSLHTPPTPWLESAVALGGAGGSAFVAVSEHTARLWRPTIGQVGVIGNGIDIDRWPIGPGGPDLVWTGRITPEKGTHLAIEAAAAAGRRLHLAGPVSDPGYFRTAVAPRLGSAVVYHGHLHQSGLAELVGSCAAALVTPCWDEPYGLVVAEALACGTPVVAFARGGIPEILDPHSGVLVAPDDTAAMAAAIPAATALPRTRVRHRARTACTQQRMVEDYLRCYRRLIDAAAPVAGLGAA